MSIRKVNGYALSISIGMTNVGVSSYLVGRNIPDRHRILSMALKLNCPSSFFTDKKVTIKIDGDKLTFK